MKAEMPGFPSTLVTLSMLLNKGSLEEACYYLLILEYITQIWLN